ncbi:3-oxoacyl-[acyl-carrier protein] reductase [Yoonia maritima]|uniref:3-oxoacyl-[acyl-carrier protein] reductase n=1 Tax=Yoonia maritima TaxID=1435347 RepID=A0A2T0W4R6_9RHOB|nr:SDR family oxidoreductase [Yoonia maritima]PRY80381.1 3-oxoacyl-[acyl-carrier protein] reductase [Yoonia maritima]
MPNDTQKSAIVTGASRGIGAAIALRLATDGYAVVVNYAGRKESADAVVGQIKQAGGTAIAMQADVSDPAQVKMLFDTTAQRFGAPHVLVNNAGVMMLAPLVDTTDANFDAMVAINLKGVFNCLREAGNQMPEGGRIVNISTSALAVNFPGYAGYCAAKAGVEAMTPIFAKELGGRNITVNAIAPGPVGTELYLTGKTQEQIDFVAGLNPMGRIGEPNDIANAVSAMVNDDTKWTNGQTIRVNGGMA